MDEQNPRVGRSPAATVAPPRPAMDETDSRTRELRVEIAETRGELSETVDAIQDRLRPSSIASAAAETVKERARSTAYEVSESQPVAYVRANRIPTLMVGIGIAGAAWLAMGGHDGHSGRARYGRGWRPEYGEYPEHASADWNDVEAAPRASAVAGDREQTGRMRSGMSTTTNDREGAWRQSQRSTTNAVSRTWNRNPLLVGAAAAIAGAIVGLSIPGTERERELMGEARDTVLNTAQETVRDRVNQVQQAATNAIGRVQDVAAGALGVASGSDDRRNA